MDGLTNGMREMGWSSLVVFVRLARGKGEGERGGGELFCCPAIYCRLSPACCPLSGPCPYYPCLLSTLRCRVPLPFAVCRLPLPSACVRLRPSVPSPGNMESSRRCSPGLGLPSPTLAHPDAPFLGIKQHDPDLSCRAACRAVRRLSRLPENRTRHRLHDIRPHRQLHNTPQCQIQSIQINPKRPSTNNNKPNESFLSFQRLFFNVFFQKKKIRGTNTGVPVWLGSFVCFLSIRGWESCDDVSSARVPIEKITIHRRWCTPMPDEGDYFPRHGPVTVTRLR